MSSTVTPKFYCESCETKREFVFVEVGERTYELNDAAEPITSSEDFDLDETFYRCLECGEEYTRAEIMEKEG